MKILRPFGESLCLGRRRVFIWSQKKMWLWWLHRQGGGKTALTCVGIRMCRRFVRCCLNHFFFFVFTFGMWLCFLIDLPHNPLEFFFFQIQFFRPEGASTVQTLRHAIFSRHTHTHLVQLHRNHWLNNWSVDATCNCDLHQWAYPRRFCHKQFFYVKKSPCSKNPDLNKN